MNKYFPRLLLVLCASACVVWGAEMPEAQIAFEAASRNFLKDRDTAKAAAEFQRVADLDPNHQPSRFSLGLIAEGKRDWAEAERWFQAAAKIDPKTSLGKEAAERVSMAREAGELSKTVEGRKKLDYRIALSRAQALLAGGSFGAAIAEGEKAAALDPRNPDAYFLLAHAEDKQGNHPAAKARLEAALKIAPPATKPLIQQAIVEVENNQKRRSEAEEARKLLQAGKYAEAAAAYGRAAAAPPESDEMKLRQAHSLILARDFSAARNILNPLAASDRVRVAKQAASYLVFANEAEGGGGLLPESLEKRAAEMVAEAAAIADSIYSSMGLHGSGVEHAVKQEIAHLLSLNLPIKSVSFTYEGGFLILYNKNDYIAQNIPEDLKQSLDADRNEGNEPVAVSFGPQNSWVVRYPGNGYAFARIAPSLAAQLKALREAGDTLGPVTLFANGGWHFVRGSNGFSFENVPAGFQNAVRDLNAKSAQISAIAASDTGAWCIVSGVNDYTAHGTADGMNAALQTIHGRGTRISTVALAPDAGWLLIEARDPIPREID